MDAPKPITPDQAVQLVPLMDQALTAALSDLNAAISEAFYQADGPYYDGLVAAKKIITDAMRPNVTKIRAVLA